MSCGSEWVYNSRGVCVHSEIVFLLERPIPFDHLMYDHLHKWGPRREEVKFFLRHEDSPAESTEQGRWALSSSPRRFSAQVNLGEMMEHEPVLVPVPRPLHSFCSAGLDAAGHQAFLWSGPGQAGRDSARSGTAAEV